MALRTRLILSVLLLSLFWTHGCKSKAPSDQTQDASVEELSPEDGVVERLQGSWTINLDETLASVPDLEEREKLVAREMLSNLRLSIDGKKGEVKTRILGSEQAQEWEFAIQNVEGDAFELCVIHENLDEPQCNSARWADEGFRLESTDGLVTYYVPAEDPAPVDGSAAADAANEDAPEQGGEAGSAANPEAGTGGE